MVSITNLNFTTEKHSMKLIKQITLGFLAVVFLLIPHILFAQPIDPCTDPEDPCPIDSNLIVLFVAAVLIAAKKAHDFKKTAAL